MGNTAMASLWQQEEIAAEDAESACPSQAVFGDRDLLEQILSQLGPVTDSAQLRAFSAAGQVSREWKNAAASLAKGISCEQKRLLAIELKTADYTSKAVAERESNEKMEALYVAHRAYTMQKHSYVTEDCARISQATARLHDLIAATKLKDQAQLELDHLEMEAKIKAAQAQAVRKSKKAEHSERMAQVGKQHEAAPEPAPQSPAAATKTHARRGLSERPPNAALQ